MTWKTFRARLTLLLGGLLFMTLLPSTSSASSLNYQRGSRVQNPHSVNRFLYTNPQYKPRKPKPVKVCKQNGRALCLTPKKRNNNYTRPPNGVPVVKVHPYLRKILKPKIVRMK
jgi:hypothetical protein